MSATKLRLREVPAGIGDSPISARRARDGFGAVWREFDGPAKTCSECRETTTSGWWRMHAALCHGCVELEEVN